MLLIFFKIRLWADRGSFLKDLAADFFTFIEYLKDQAPFEDQTN